MLYANPGRSPQRILMTADTLGGVWDYALELGQGLQERGSEVWLATMGRRLSREQARQATGRGLRVCESEYRLEWMQNPWEDVRQAGEWLLALEDKFRPDLVHLNGYAHAALPWRAPVVVAGHSCVLSWWRAVRGNEAPPEWTFYRMQVKRGLARADLIIAPTRNMLENLDWHYGPLRPERCQVIPNGRYPGHFAPGAKQPYILTVGRIWDEAKNIAALDQVAGSLNWPVYVAGEPKHPENGLELNPARHLCLLGHLSHGALSGWFAGASIYALPACYEPFGLSVLEAALSGCALVLGDIPSLRENWEGAAVFVRPGRVEALQEALQSLIKDVSRRQALAAAARGRALQYPSRRMVDGYLAAYRHLPGISGGYPPALTQQSSFS